MTALPQSTRWFFSNQVVRLTNNRYSRDQPLGRSGTRSTRRPVLRDTPARNSPGARQSRPAIGWSAWR